MTAKEKAKQLAEEFWHLVDKDCEIENGFEFGVKCAKIAVREIIDENRTNLVYKYFWTEVLDELNAHNGMDIG